MADVFSDAVLRGETHCRLPESFRRPLSIPCCSNRRNVLRNRGERDDAWNTGVTSMIWKGPFTFATVEEAGRERWWIGVITGILVRCSGLKVKFLENHVEHLISIFCCCMILDHLAEVTPSVYHKPSSITPCGVGFLTFCGGLFQFKSCQVWSPCTRITCGIS